VDLISSHCDDVVVVVFPVVVVEYDDDDDDEDDDDDDDGTLFCRPLSKWRRIVVEAIEKMCSEGVWPTVTGAVLMVSVQAQTIALVIQVTHWTGVAIVWSSAPVDA
jgi:hypothetical protein